MPSSYASMSRRAPWTMPDLRARSGGGGFYAIDSFVPMYQPRRSVRFPSPESPKTRNKVASYKTKPCKFFRPESGCPNGEECTFIHDQSENRAPDPHSSQHQTLPSRPLSQHEINIQHEFYPVSWRVIGGGVMMSSPKNDTPPDRDWTLIAPSQPEEAIEEAVSVSDSHGTSPKSPTLSASLGRRRPRANLGLSLDAGSLKPPITTPETPTPARPIPHLRPTSTPPAPGMVQLIMTNRFSRETP